MLEPDLFGTFIILINLISAQGWICPNGVNLAGYSGNVSITNDRLPCRKWADTTTVLPYRLTEAHFPNDESKEAASNYCRNFNNEEIPWCFTTWPSQIRQNCYFSICGFENFAFRVCGGDITSPSGWLAASNTEVDRCNWALHAPEGYIIEVNVTFLYMNTEIRCHYSYLAIFETSHYDSDFRFCGKSTPTVRSTSNRLYIVFYPSSYYALKNESFHLTYSHIIAKTKGSNITTRDTITKTTKQKVHLSDDVTTRTIAGVSEITEATLHASDISTDRPGEQHTTTSTNRSVKIFSRMTLFVVVFLFHQIRHFTA